MNDLNARALDPAKCVVVSACAGSGKTWLLVSRIVRALLDGAQPGEILAITFTRKAAREMQSRLTGWLKQMATADDATVERMLLEREVPAARVVALLPVARGLYEKLLTAEPGITITTFHSWFLQLMRRAPLDAGVPGDAALSEETAALIEEAWQRFASAAEGDTAQALDTLYMHYGPDSTRRTLTHFLQRRGDWWAYVADAGSDEAAIARSLEALRAGMPVAPDADVPQGLHADAPFNAQLAEFVALLDKNGIKEDIKGVEALRRAVDESNAKRWLQQIEIAFLTQKHELRKRKASAAQAKRLGAQGEARYLDIHQSAGQRVLDALNAMAWQQGYRFNAAALTCGATFTQTYQALKRERRVIDYTDIEWCAHQLLCDSEHAVYLMCKLDARYRHVLLDEFQDTNPLQWLTLRRWFESSAEVDSRPSVFLVGDPKQSIYRFRRAEARLFTQAAEYLREQFGAELLSQDISRRCAPAVLGAVNSVFAGEAEFEDYREHHAHHGAMPGRVDVVALIGKDEDDGSEAIVWRDPFTAPLIVPEDSRRAREAAQLAEGAKAIAGHWWIAADDAGKTGRLARYGDIMILVRRRTHLAVYEEALRHAGVPYVTSRQGGLLDTLEVLDLIALLTFLVSPFDNLSLAHALRSPVFACSDDDLAALAHAVRREPGRTWWEALSLEDDSRFSPALVRARRLLASWLARADALPVHDQLDRIYFEADVLQRYHGAVPAAMRGAVAANLNAFMHRALDADAGRYLSLPRFVADLAELRAAPAVEAPDEGMIGDAGDAVRIHTVHGAKGLEAAVVWLPDATAQPGANRGYDVLLDWPAEAPRPAHFSMWARKEEQTPLQREIVEREGDFARRENLNLLYVAMTRAKQALIVSGIESKTSDPSWYDKIRAAAGSAVSASCELESENYQQKQQLVVDAPLMVAADAALARPLPTGTRRTREGGTGAQRGTQFHALMELLTQTPPAGRAAIQRTLNLPDDAFDALWREAGQVLADTQYQRYFDAARYVRAANEVPLINERGEGMRIDRLVEFEEEVVVLDYKTGAMHSVDAALAEDYRAQVRGYCVHISHAMPSKRVRGLILFTGGGSIDVTN